MIILALKLVLAHLLGDFAMQPGLWVRDKVRQKHRSPYLYAHIAVHAVLLLLLLQFNMKYWLGLILILVTHLLIDIAKLYLQEKTSSRSLFFLDQLAHFVVLGLVVNLYFPLAIELDWLFHPLSLLFITSIVLVTMVSAIVMRQVMGRWEFAEDKAEESLPNAGKYIGILERLFVFTFIVLNQWQAIGFLIAAKSILRFSDLSRAKDRKLTEYVLIGTLLSFGLAILVALLFSFLRNYSLFQI